MRILPYSMGSRSARALSGALGIRRVRHDSPTFTNRYDHLIINWGSARLPRFPVNRWLNHPDMVNRAGNKLLAFRAMREEDVSIPEFTTDRRTAVEMSEDGHTIVCRHLLRGHSGAGIQIVTPEEDVPSAPLYVKYIKKKHEYRIHVFNGEVIDVQQKKRRRDGDSAAASYQVRNLETGWIYCRGDIDCPDSCLGLGVDAVSVLGLDFGAVDIVWNEYRQQGYVLEVNTACGLEGTTVERYAEAVRRM